MTDNGVALYTCNQCGAAVVDDQRPVKKGGPDPDGIPRHNMACRGLGGPRGSYDMKGYTFVLQLIEGGA